MRINNEPHRGHFDQVFVNVSREMEVSRWKVEPTIQGWYWQGFDRESNAKTLELSVRASRPVGPFRLFTSHTVENWLIAGANAAFNRTYLGVDTAALNYTQWGVAVTKHSKHGWYARPHAEVVITMAAPNRSAVDSRNLFNAGISIGRGK
jgi:hypothetical protein